MWVLQGTRDVSAYDLADGTRQDGTGGTTDKELTLSNSAPTPSGMWADETTLYIAS